VSWGARFDDPIALANGRKLLTLQDAATHITNLPKRESDLPEWQAAIEALMFVADRGGPTMFARIGVMRALNRQSSACSIRHRRKSIGPAQTRARSMKQEAVGVAA
jgi:hypothetical protein